MDWLIIILITLLIGFIPGLLDLLFEITINPIACFFSSKMRKKRWEGYSGLLYTEKPLLTTSANRMIDLIKKEGSDIHTEMRKARKGESKYFSDETTMKIFPEIKPTDKELGFGFTDLFRIFVK